MTHLAVLSHAELLDLFATLEAPPIDELNGEYGRRMLAQKWPGELAAMNIFLARGPYGRWLGKAFDGGQGDGAGEGYNYFRRAGRGVRALPMLTTVAPSRFDRRPSFQLVYRGFRSLGGSVHMVDEIRTVEPGHYLALGTFGFTTAQRMRPLPFELTGPESPYRGKIGARRKSFDLEIAIRP